MERGGRPPLGRWDPVVDLPGVAVTGGPACGKSSLGRLLAERGADVLDADTVVHRLQQPGAALHVAIRKEFGDEYLTTDGRVDRVRLGGLVFADPDARRRLEALSHPAVRAWIERWRLQPAKAWAKVALIPLLVESGWETDWDRVVCVTCSPERQFERLRERGLSAADIRRRLAAQAPMEEKVRCADWVVKNDRDWVWLAAAADAIRQRVVEMNAV